tara:strand:+ start:3837 stop:4232 length:396 start_codon:yes stop_codon:yes gene_type:complete
VKSEESQKARLETDITRLLSERDKEATDRKQAEMDAGTLRTDLGKAQIALEVSQSTAVAAESRVQALTAKSEQQVGTINTLQAELSHANTANGQLQEQLAAVTEKMTGLDDQVKNANARVRIPLKPATHSI